MDRNKFSEAIDWLKKLESESQFFRKVQPSGLGVVNTFLDALGRPDKKFSYRVVIGGTAGKGTVCRLVEDVLVRSGKKVTTLFSPHVQVVTERIRINGKLISPKLFGEYLLRVHDIAEHLQVFPTYYEAIVLAGILAGAENASDILVAEVGCGGELDAVNAVQGRRIAALTFVGEDHMHLLGGSLEKIAETKSGIFTADSVLNVSGEKKFQKILQSRGTVKFIKGIPQKLNKKIAREICEEILGTSEFEMRKVHIPARWEILRNPGSNTCILDGAHSGPRFEYILPKIKKIIHPRVGVFALAKSHDAETFKTITDEFDEIIWTNVLGNREFWKPEELRALIEKGEMEIDPLKAFQRAQKKEGTIFVLGSFYLCGMIRDLFYDPEKILEQGSEFSL